MMARKAALVAVAALFATACRDAGDRGAQGKAQRAPSVALSAPMAGPPNAAAPTNVAAPINVAPANVSGPPPASPPGAATPAPLSAPFDGGAMASADGGAPIAAASATQPSSPAPPSPPGLSAARLAVVQAALQAAKIDAWLLTDFRRSDPIALRVLGLEGPSEAIGTRRWFYLVPAKGLPQKLLHAIEPSILEASPGASTVYSSWRTRDRELGRLLRGLRSVAMNWSPRNDLPTASRVDGGTVELIRSMGPEVVSSAELVAQLESTLTSEQLAGQARAAELLGKDLDATADEAARRLKAGAPATERELQDFLLQRWAQEGLVGGGRGIVAVDAHTALPHYSAPEQGSSIAGQNSVLLIDCSARLANDPRAVWADLTRVYFLGEKTPDEVARVAAVVFKARDAALELLKYRAEYNRSVTGAEVDNAARKVVTDAGFGERFLHRTGHSIDTHGHGDGVNNDDFETHDTRKHLAETCFSIEPGIYVTGRFGVRSEIDVCLTKGANGKLLVDVRGGALQTSVPALLAR